MKYLNLELNSFVAPLLEGTVQALAYGSLYWIRMPSGDY